MYLCGRIHVSVSGPVNGRSRTNVDGILTKSGDRRVFASRNLLFIVTVCGKGFYRVLFLLKGRAQQMGGSR